MKANELIKLLNDGGLSKYSALYSDLERAKKRFITAINEFTKTYGTEKDIALFSVPGRSEIIPAVPGQVARRQYLPLKPR